jgi:hypothetical protein
MEQQYNGWAILELMGHRRLGGWICEVEMYGAKMCRIVIPDGSDASKTYATQYYGGSSIYCLTPCTEAAALAAAKLSQPEPVQSWELPQLESGARNVPDSADDSTTEW